MKIFILCLTFCLVTSCTTSIISPASHIEYTGAIEEKGLSLTIKPPGWYFICELYAYLTEEE
jgi:hypothetical protein